MNKKYIVRLTDDERKVCEQVVKDLKGKSEKLRRAQILLKADLDGPGWKDEKISEAIGCRVRTVENVRMQLVLEGFEAALISIHMYGIFVKLNVRNLTARAPRISWGAVGLSRSSSPFRTVNPMMPAPTRVARRRQTYEEDQPFWLFRLETWLVLASIALFFQVFPHLFWNLLYLIDVRNWTWGVWVGVEIAEVATLLVLYAWQKSD